jgi:hypothetical protein
VKTLVFLLSENELFGLVFVKTGSINSGTGLYLGFFVALSSLKLDELLENSGRCGGRRCTITSLLL